MRSWRQLILGQPTEPAPAVESKNDPLQSALDKLHEAQINGYGVKLNARETEVVAMNMRFLCRSR